MIPKPRTIIVPALRAHVSEAIETPKRADQRPDTIAYMDAFWPKFYKAADEIGYPLFMRTDLVSGKHDWNTACYVPNKASIGNRFYRVIEANETAGMLGVDYSAMMLREYIPLASRFTAFRGMPVAPERRYFVKDGKVQCHHPYWPERAIHGSMTTDLPADWRFQLQEMNHEDPSEVFLLTGYAQELGRALRGHWSFDFALAKDGRWIFIDAATAGDSWHPDCPTNGAGNDDEDVDLTDEELGALLIPSPIPTPKIPEPQ